MWMKFDFSFFGKRLAGKKERFSRPILKEKLAFPN
jgi:hypothetical protein